jgi:cell division protein FtsW
MNMPVIYAKGDRTIWIVVLLLSLLSILAVYTSTGTLAYSKQGGDTEHYLIKHTTLIVTGLVMMYLVHLLHYRFFSRIGQLGIFLAIPLLAMTLMSGEINDASRWLTVPILNLSFQTSDFAKLALVLYLARMLSRKQENIKEFKQAFMPLMAPIIIVCGLILPANFSTSALLFTASMVMLFIGRVNFSYIIIFVGVGIVAFLLFVFVAQKMEVQGRIGTWMSRIENFSSDDGEGSYQKNQAKFAIANGGLIGMGPGNSEQRNFLPHPYSDFIFAIIIEEGGIVLGAFVLLLYLILFLRVIRMVKNSPQSFATFLAVGCTLVLLFQAFINMAVAVSLFPVTGQALPLVSMGGTSVWFTSISIGIILCVSRFCTPDGKEESHAA